jgi:hypothetical protein
VLPGEDQFVETGPNWLLVMLSRLDVEMKVKVLMLFLEGLASTQRCDSWRWEGVCGGVGFVSGELYRISTVSRNGHPG